MNSSNLATSFVEMVVWGLPGFLLAMFLPGRLAAWVILASNLASLRYTQSLPIKPTRLDRTVSWFVILFHPVPLAVIAGVTVLIHYWPFHLGMAAMSFWVGFLLGTLTAMSVIVVATLKFFRKKRLLQRAGASQGGTEQKT